MFFAVTSWASLTVGITYWLDPKIFNANFVLTKTKRTKNGTNGRANGLKDQLEVYLIWREK